MASMQPPSYDSVVMQSQIGGAIPPKDGFYPPQPVQPPQQAGYLPPPTAYPQVTYSSGHPTTVVIATQLFRDCPVNATCPHCQQNVRTQVKFQTGAFTWVVSLIVAIFGCCLGCCFIPFCVNSCKDAVHTCPNCRQIVARWNRM